LLILFAVLFLAGVALTLYNLLRSRTAITEEHDRHLLQLCNTVDHSISNILDICRNEMTWEISEGSFHNAEATWQKTGNTANLRRLLETNALLPTGYADRIVVFSGEQAILSTVAGDALNYSFLPEDDGDDIWLCVDQTTGKSFIALSLSSQTVPLTYFALVDQRSFFQRVVAEGVWEDYWIVLYDPGSGFALQNSDNQPEYKVFTPRQMLSRNDGYTVIYQRQQSGQAGASPYCFVEPDGSTQDIRIYVIPSTGSENGIFAVGVSIFNEHISVPANQMTLYSIIAGMLVAFSAAGAVFMLLHSGKRERELAMELATLEKENQLSEELLRQQDKLVHQQRLQTIGTLTAGIAHEFNNMLSPIMSNSMLILEKSRTLDEDIFDTALEIYQASDRAKELVLKISRLSRRQSSDAHIPVAVSTLLAGVLSISSASIPANITVKTQIAQDIRILGDEGQLGHMLLNLVINSVQAMSPGGGTLTLSADSDGETVRITVADTGPGIPQELLNNIFDPFFTTKQVGSGTGLGLAIAQRTANNHCGELTAENLPEGGAKFTFTVPACPPE